MVAVLVLAGCGSDAGDQAAQAQDPGSVVASGDESAGQSEDGAIPEASSVDADGLTHSGIPASGEYTTNTIDIAPSTDQPDVRDYAVQVETSTGLDADDVAAQIQQILDSDDGWVGYQGVAFHLIDDPATADLVITLGSPESTDTGCGALDTDGAWSCRVEDHVYANVDRWWYATPTWEGYPLDEYRAYLINHEVGHYLGFDHVNCPTDGSPSPVMQQQSIYLNGCVPNAWPSVTGENVG